MDEFNQYEMLNSSCRKPINRSCLSIRTGKRFPWILSDCKSDVGNTVEMSTDRLLSEKKSLVENVIVPSDINVEKSYGRNGNGKLTIEKRIT